MLESEKGEIELKKKGEKRKRTCQKDILLPRSQSQLYKEDLQEADRFARQLWELHTRQTTNLSSNHHLQERFAQNLQVEDNSVHNLRSGDSLRLS